MQSLPTTYIIIGFMAAGKTTAARAAAQLLQAGFCDLDALIETRTGQSIAQIFSEKGEAGFREIENRCLVDALRESAGLNVIAAGGGLPTFAANLPLMARCRVIFLDTAWPVIADRLEAAAAERPLLRGLDHAQAKALWERRRQLYLNVADFVIVEDSQLPELIKKLTAGTTIHNE